MASNSDGAGRLIAASQSYQRLIFGMSQPQTSEDRRSVPHGSCLPEKTRGPLPLDVPTRPQQYRHPYAEVVVMQTRKPSAPLKGILPGPDDEVGIVTSGRVVYGSR